MGAFEGGHQAVRGGVFEGGAGPALVMTGPNANLEFVGNLDTVEFAFVHRSGASRADDGGEEDMVESVAGGVAMRIEEGGHRLCE